MKSAFAKNLLSSSRGSGGAGLCEEGGHQYHDQSTLRITDNSASSHSQAITPLQRRRSSGSEVGVKRSKNSMLMLVFTLELRCSLSGAECAQHLRLSAQQTPVSVRQSRARAQGARAPERELFA